MSEQVSNGDSLHRGWNGLLATGKELSELVPDLLGLGDGPKCDLVANLGILSATCNVLDEVDRTLAADQLSNDALQILGGLLLPRLTGDVGRNSGQAKDHEAVLVTLIDLDVAQLGVHGDLEVND